MKLYKYMESRFAARFLRDGDIRLGTLYGFRNVERFGEVIGEAEEGRKYVRKQGHSVVDTAYPETVPYFLKQRINVAAPNRLRIEARDGIGGMMEDPDGYVLCLTDQPDVAQMRQFGYDSCLEVLDSDEFFRAISVKVRHQLRFWGAAKVVYRNRTMSVHEDEAIPPAFIKPPSYAGQKEVRGLWEPFNPGAVLSPKIVRSKKAARVCRLYAGDQPDGSSRQYWRGGGG